MTEYWPDFVRESEERITELNNALLTLERHPDDEEAMENIFRIAHTLKGNCGAAGLERASDLAHAIEDVLDAVRSGDLEVTSELMDAIFDAVDELETMVREVDRHGEIETDPSDRIAALRDHLDAPAGLRSPTEAEIDDVVADLAPPANDDHEAYLARLSIADTGEGVNDGMLVVEALIDAFELIGTEPPREAIAAGDYGDLIDAVFASPVSESAIASGLEPVEEVADFEIVRVTDRIGSGSTSGGATAASAAEGDDPFADLEPGTAPSADLSPDEAQELEVDELLDEFNEFDDLDELVEDVEEDEDLEAFEDMGEAGSFDDLLEDVEADAEAEPDADAGAGTAPEADDEPQSAAEEAGTDDAATGADGDAPGSEPATAPASDDEEVEDASAVFEELKDEVEMVGFDELQDELEELEFDEFDSDEEVGMDELLGDEVDEESGADDPFLEGGEGDGSAGVAVDEAEDEHEHESEAEEGPTPEMESESDPEPDPEPESEPESATSPEQSAEADPEPAAEAASSSDDPTPDTPSSGDDSIPAEADATSTATTDEPEVGADDELEDTSAGTGPFPGVAPDAEGASAEDDAGESEPEGVGADDELEAGGTEVDESADAVEAETPSTAEEEPHDPEFEDGESVDLSDIDASIADAEEDGVAAGEAEDDANADGAWAATDDEVVDFDDGDVGADDSDSDEKEDEDEAEVTADPDPEPEDEAAEPELDTEEPTADVDAGSEPELEDEEFDDTAAEFDDAFGDASDADFESETTFDTGFDDEPTEFETDTDLEDTDGFDDAEADFSVETSFDADEFGNDGVAESDADGTTTVDPASTVGTDGDDGDDEDPDETGGFQFESTVESSTADADATSELEPTDPADDVIDADADTELDDALEAGDETDVIDEIDLDDPELGSGVEEFGASGVDDEFSSIESEAAEGGFDDEPDGRPEPESDREPERVVEEPEFEVPDLTVPEPAGRTEPDERTEEIQSVRVDVDRIDDLRTLVEGLVTTRIRLRHAAEAGEDVSEIEPELDDLTDLTTDLQETVMDVRLVPLETVVNRLPRIVRDIAREQEKEVAFDLSGEGVELDRSILDRIRDPLIHLVRNAVDHGIEPPEEREAADKPREGSVEVTASRSRGRATITVTDDGAGLDPDRLRSEAIDAGVLEEEEAEELSDDEVYDLAFHPGFSTADSVTDVSGRGVGMDVVKRTVEDLDGTVEIESEPGEGTTVTMTLPVSIAIEDVLFLEVGDAEFGVPTKVVQDVESTAMVQSVDGEPTIVDGDQEYRVLELGTEFGFDAERELEVGGDVDAGAEAEAGVAVASDSATGGDVGATASEVGTRTGVGSDATGDEGMIVRIRDDVRPIALHCDRVRDQQEVVVKPFEGFMGGIPGLSGATVRGRGQVVNILDVTTL